MLLIEFITFRFSPLSLVILYDLKSPFSSLIILYDPRSISICFVITHLRLKAYNGNKKINGTKEKIKELKLNPKKLIGKKKKEKAEEIKRKK